jgi:hypothetical protein
MNTKEGAEMPVHMKDADCHVDAETDCCVICGTYHGDPCHICGGRGFHMEGCRAAEAA